MHIQKISSYIKINKKSTDTKNKTDKTQKKSSHKITEKKSFMDLSCLSALGKYLVHRKKNQTFENETSEQPTISEQNPNSCDLKNTINVSSQENNSSISGTEFCDIEQKENQQLLQAYKSKITTILSNIGCNEHHFEALSKPDNKDLYNALFNFIPEHNPTEAKANVINIDAKPIDTLNTIMRSMYYGVVCKDLPETLLQKEILSFIHDELDRLTYPN